MKNLFEQFANGNAEVTSKDFCINGTSIEFYGNITITKGGLSYNLDYSARLYEMKNLMGYVGVDDWEGHGATNYVFNGIPIDNFIEFRNTLTSSGLATVAKSLEVSYKEEGKQIAIELQNHKVFKKIYGKNTIIFDTLTEDEKNILKLEYCIANYSKLQPSNWLVVPFKEEIRGTDEHGNVTTRKVIPPIEVLVEKLTELKSK
jgi:hypothetical protein